MARGTNVKHLAILAIGVSFMYYFLSVIWLLIIDTDKNAADNTSFDGVSYLQYMGDKS